MPQATEDELAFTNANFARVVSDLASAMGKKTSEMAYGMWNPDFCAADARVEAETFFAALEEHAAYWLGKVRASTKEQQP